MKDEWIVSASSNFTKLFTRVIYWKPNVEKTFPLCIKDKEGNQLTYTTASKFYDSCLDISLRDVKEDNFVLLHHRKWVYGSNVVDNVHPFVWERFTLVQNGSSKAIHNWGKIEFIGEEDKTDSYYILKYIERHWANSLEDVSVLLKQISTCAWDELGVVVVVDNISQEILFYMDWARSLYIDKTEDKINYISSLKDNTLVEYFNKGKLIIDFDWNIIFDWLEWALNYQKSYWNNSYNTQPTTTFYSKKKNEDTEEEKKTITWTNSQMQLTSGKETEWKKNISHGNTFHGKFVPESHKRSDWVIVFNTIDDASNYLDNVFKELALAKDSNGWAKVKQIYKQSSISNADEAIRMFCLKEQELERGRVKLKRELYTHQASNNIITKDDNNLLQSKLTWELLTNLQYFEDIQSHYNDEYKRWVNYIFTY